MSMAWNARPQMAKSTNGIKKKKNKKNSSKIIKFICLLEMSVLPFVLTFRMIYGCNFVGKMVWVRFDILLDMFAFPLANITQNTHLLHFFFLRSKKAMTDELQQKRRISVEFIMKAGRSCIYPEISTIYVRFEQEKSNCSQIEHQFSIYYSQYNTQMHTLHTPIQCAASERTQHHANPRLLLLCSVCIYVAYPKGNRTQTLY